MSKERSPFSPGKPVSPGLFMGRQEQVKLIDRAIRQAVAGSPQYLFITGERGIGKSSLASFSLELARREYGFVGAHALLGSANNLEEACRRIYESLVGQMSDKSLLDKAREVFKRYISKVDLFGIGVEFKDDDQTRAGLTENFLPLLAQAVAAFREEGAKGIMLIADDLNGVTADPRFARFLKSTVDQIAVGPMRELPWVLVLVGVPERMDDLKARQPSVDRIFQPIELSLLSPGAARGFYERAFRSVDHDWEDEAISLMARVVGGFPVMWHELGDAVFWEDQDEKVSLGDVTTGIVAAADSVGRKYLKRPLYDELRSPVYRNILRFLAGRIGKATFGKPVGIRRVDALAQLPTKEAKNFDNFIKKMRKLGVLRLAPGRRGEYQFTNFLFQFYVFLQSVAGSRQLENSLLAEGSDGSY